MSHYHVNGVGIIFGNPSRTYTVPSEGTPPYRAIVSLGESNSGGTGSVASLPSELSAPTSRVQIMVTSTGQFASLDLGTNNNLAHDGLDPTQHGWEAGLIPYMDANPIAQTEPVYLIQCGQGGSRVTQWANGGTYWTAAQTRINQAKAEFDTLGISPVWEIWFTLGINDIVNGELTPAQYKAGCVTLLNEVRAMIGNGTATRVRSPMFFDSVRASAPDYLAAHESIGDTVPNYEIVAAADLENDGAHWTSSAYVALGQRMAGDAVYSSSTLTPVPLNARLVATGHSIVDGVIKWPWSGVITDAGLTPAMWAGVGPFASAQYRWANSALIGDGVRALMETPGADYDLFLGIEATGGTAGGRSSVQEHISFSEGYLHALRWHNLAASTGAQTFYANFWRNDPAELFDAAWRGVQDAEQVLWDGIIDHVNTNRDEGTPAMRLVPWGQVFCAVYDAIEAGTVTGITMGDMFFDDIHVSANLGTWVQMATMMAVMYQRHPDQLSNVVNLQFGGTLSIDSGLAAQLRPVIWSACLATPRTGLGA